MKKDVVSLSFNLFYEESLELGKLFQIMAHWRNHFARVLDNEIHFVSHSANQKISLPVNNFGQRPDEMQKFVENHMRDGEFLECYVYGVSGKEPMDESYMHCFYNNGCASSKTHSVSISLLIDEIEPIDWNSFRKDICSFAIEWNPVYGYIKAVTPYNYGYYFHGPERGPSRLEWFNLFGPQYDELLKSIPSDKVPIELFQTEEGVTRILWCCDTPSTYETRATRKLRKYYERMVGKGFFSSELDSELKKNLFILGILDTKDASDLPRL